jgi:uncharacterized protein YijF (DUF1287 family)
MMRLRWFSSIAWHFAIVACLLAGCDQTKPKPMEAPASGVSTSPSVLVTQETKQRISASPIVTAARKQIGKTVSYDPAYVGLAYPGGDLPIEKGVCTDVVVRALRYALTMDLQKLVHEDMKAAFSSYPKIWGLKKTDRNIDHRRVPNLMTYFKRQGYSVAITQDAEDYLPGDLVTCTVGRNLAHIMVVSDRKTDAGVPFVIHNIGSGTREEDRLFNFPMTGHYRIKERTRTR